MDFHYDPDKIMFLAIAVYVAIYLAVKFYQGKGLDDFSNYVFSRLEKIKNLYVEPKRENPELPSENENE